MFDPIIEPGKLELIAEQARQRGYDNPTDYLLDLVKADADEHALPEPIGANDLIAKIDELEFTPEEAAEMAKAIQTGRQIDHAEW